MPKLPVIDWLEGFSSSVNGTDGSTNRSERVRLDQIRRHDFSGSSDAQLREMITLLARKPVRDPGEDNLPEVFAVVNEAITRREGAWRFFDSMIKIKDQQLQAIHELASSVSQSVDYQTAVSEFAPINSYCWESFNNYMVPMLVRQGLEPWEQTLVGAVLYVNQRSQSEYLSLIHI